MSKNCLHCNSKVENGWAISGGTPIGDHLGLDSDEKGELHDDCFNTLLDEMG